ncbi:Hypothetical predicted protein [Cloeon dipterum]|uniref:Uncharacterized protein n=1 Tax=Cloeon dipterum TaxID=197152 RepID=A0A8S1DLD3_9INSE|nr:Hypothetical predicted protein [Cloeon dipterum]
MPAEGREYPRPQPAGPMSAMVAIAIGCILVLLSVFIVLIIFLGSSSVRISTPEIHPHGYVHAEVIFATPLSIPHPRKTRVYFPCRSNERISDAEAPAA